MQCATQGKECDKMANECERTDKSAQKKFSLYPTVPQCVRVDHDLDCAPLQRPEVASAPAVHLRPVFLHEQNRRHLLQVWKGRTLGGGSVRRSEVQLLRQI